MERVVIQIVEDNAFADSEVLDIALMHWFLEECVETQRLFVVFEPLWRALGDALMFRFCSTWRDTFKFGWCAFSHRFQEFCVHLLFKYLR